MTLNLVTVIYDFLCAKCYVIHILLDRIKSNQIKLIRFVGGFLMKQICILSLRETAYYIEPPQLFDDVNSFTYYCPKIFKYSGLLFEWIRVYMENIINL